MNSRTFLLIPLVVLLLNSCGENGSELSPVEEENMVNLEENDERVIDAKDSAQANLGLFSDIFASDTATGYDFYIKSSFAYTEDVEHMWSSVLAIDEAKNRFQVRLDNEPYFEQEFALGDTLWVQSNEIEDFIIYQGQQVVLGSYLDL